ncbi:MAG: hypothetical protein L6R37_002116 [Teloschistes peruensis]|nr:MAG: hypothetical protein L6R37_002116 [Teloschistes peruensis]
MMLSKGRTTTTPRPSILEILTFLLSSLVFLSPFCLLLLSPHATGIPLQSQTHQQENQQPSLNPIPQTIPSAPPSSIAILFGHQHHAPHFTPLHPQKPKHRRDVLTFEQSRCRGSQRYENAPARLPRRAAKPRPDVPAARFQQRMGAEPGGESAEAVVEQWSIETVGHAVWGDEMNQTKAEQPFEYRTFGGDFEEPTAAEYHLQFIRPAAVIIALDIKSPLQQILADGINLEEAIEILPPLNRFSDMAWFLWSDILARQQTSTAGPVDALPANGAKAANDPGRLRHIGHDLVRSPDTESIIFQIIRDKNGGGSNEAAWPAHTFSMREPEGLALLGTPNAVGTAWILVHRAAALGRREPRVRIWTASPGYLCMLWYLDDA